MIDKGQEIFDGTVSQLKGDLWQDEDPLPLNCYQVKVISVLTMKALSDMTIDRQGNSLNIEFDSPRFPTSRLILSSKPCLILKSRDLKMVDTDIEDIIRRFYRKEL